MAIDTRSRTKKGISGVTSGGIVLPAYPDRAALRAASASGWVVSGVDVTVRLVGTSAARVE